MAQHLSLLAVASHNGEAGRQASRLPPIHKVAEGHLHAVTWPHLIVVQKRVFTVLVAGMTIRVDDLPGGFIIPSRPTNRERLWKGHLRDDTCRPRCCFLQVNITSLACQGCMSGGETQHACQECMSGETQHAQMFLRLTICVRGVTPRSSLLAKMSDGICVSLHTFNLLTGIVQRMG
eukprot:1151773-Pelagomonas_calceolata.AAC.1